MIYKGYKRGIIFELAALAGIILGCYLAVHFSKWLADLLPIDGEYTLLIAFFIIFIGVIILSGFLGKCLEGLVKLVHVGVMNKILGAVLGLAKAVCILAVILDFVMIVDSAQIIVTAKMKDGSLFYEPVHSVGKKMTKQLQIYAMELKEQRETQQ